MKTARHERSSHPIPTTVRQSSAIGTVWENVRQLLIALVLALVIKTSVVEAYKIPTGSMEDTLLVGDFLLANKFIYGVEIPLVGWRLPAFREPQPGDIVIFIFPGDGITKYIKRCVAKPGDTVVVKNKELFVNGKRFEDPQFSKFTNISPDGQQLVQPRGPGGKSSPDNFGPYVVPRNNYFMMGDNRDNSYDSRFWGTVRREAILGEAMVVHWSWDEELLPSPEVTVSDPLSVPRMFLFNVRHFFEKVRWSRLFSPIE